MNFAYKSDQKTMTSLFVKEENKDIQKKWNKIQSQDGQIAENSMNTAIKMSTKITIHMTLMCSIDGG